MHVIVASFILWWLMTTGIASEVAAVDSFIADASKTLYGAPPEFGPTTRFHRGVYEWDAKWPIADGLGIVTTGHLRIVVRPGLSLGPSVSLVFNRQMVSRLDFAPATECETNPLWARALNMPPRVCGPHFHGWEQNRSHVLKEKEWHLPCREPLPPQIRRFDQAFPWLADRINLVLTPGQRQFSLPVQLV